MERVCVVDGCEQPPRAKGYCHRHAENLRRRGVAVIIPATLMERLWSRIERRGRDECWPWRGGRSSAGYGTFNLGSRRYDYAHRVLYEMIVEPIPEGLTIDHRCHNEDPTCPGGNACEHRACMNLRHFDVVTKAENNRRARERLRGWTP